MLLISVTQGAVRGLFRERAGGRGCGEEMTGFLPLDLPENWCGWPRKFLALQPEVLKKGVRKQRERAMMMHAGQSPNALHSDSAPIPDSFADAPARTASAISPNSAASDAQRNLMGYRSFQIPCTARGKSLFRVGLEEVDLGVDLSIGARTNGNSPLRSGLRM